MNERSQIAKIEFNLKLLKINIEAAWRSGSVLGS
jgi:hypothetical protein